MHAVEVTKNSFEVIGAPGDRQSQRYAELFVVALKGLAGTTLGNQVARMRPEAF